MIRLKKSIWFFSIAITSAACGYLAEFSENPSPGSPTIRTQLPQSATQAVKAPAHDIEAEITVNGAIRYQVFEGFGGTLTSIAEEGVYNRHDPSQPVKTTATQEQLRGIAELLYGQLGLTRTRLFMINHEPVNDDQNPFNFNAQAFDWSIVDELINYVGIARPNGLSN